VIGDAGLIVPEGDPTVLGEALRRLEQDPELRLRLGQRDERACWSTTRMSA
jgi:glycosyltransferase involved in cell wall biosynthesis